MYALIKRSRKMVAALLGIVFIICMFRMLSATTPQVTSYLHALSKTRTPLHTTDIINNRTRPPANIVTSSAKNKTTQEPLHSVNIMNTSPEANTVTSSPSTKSNTSRTPVYNANTVNPRPGPPANVTSPTENNTTHAPLYSDNIINPDVYEFTSSNNNYCQSQNSSEPFLVILVKSKPTNRLDRQQIRQTWGGKMIVNGSLTLTVFLLGRSSSPDVNKRIQEESEHYHDIVQGNFIDAYYNLTIKTVMGMKWVTMFCRNVSYLASADDDVMLNTTTLVRRLRDKPRQKYAEGRLRINDIPIRRKGSKWYSSKAFYPESTYAPYFPGSCYVMSVDVAYAVYRESKHVRFLRLDDVFVGLAMKRAGIEPKRGKGYAQFVNTKSESSIKNALEHGIVAVINHQSSDTDMKRLVDLWNSLSQ